MIKDVAFAQSLTSVLNIMQKPDLHVPSWAEAGRNPSNCLKFNLWLIRECLHCSSRCLKQAHFNSTEKVVDNIKLIKSPVLALLENGESSAHAVVLWQGHIIDYESKHTYPISVHNLKFAGGINCVNHGFRIAYVISPSTVMKKKYKQCKGKYDWGGQDEKQIKHLFK